MKRHLTSLAANVKPRSLLASITVTFVLFLSALSTSGHAQCRNLDVKGPIQKCYDKPVVMGQRLDYCVSKTECGKPSADLFCRHRGHDRAFTWRTEYVRRAWLPPDHQCVSGETISCRGFKHIICVGSTWMPDELWKGSWDTNYGSIEFKQSGRDVEGTYQGRAFCIRGILSQDGRTLEGWWYHTRCENTENARRSGQLRFALEDFTRWTGEWWEKGQRRTSWNGSKISRGRASSGPDASFCKPEWWDGRFKTAYRGLSLSVSGGHARGTYNVQKHDIKGVISNDGCALDGTWHHKSGGKRTGRSGEFEFVRTRDSVAGHDFRGRWRDRGKRWSTWDWWGDKVGDTP